MTNLSPKQKKTEENSKNDNTTAFDYYFEPNEEENLLISQGSETNSEEIGIANKSQKLKPLEKLSKLVRLNSSSLTLRDSLLFILLPTVIVPLLIASSISAIVTQKNSETRIKERLNERGILASRATDRLLDNTFELPEMLAANPLVIRAAKTVAQKAREEKLPQLLNNPENIKRLENRYQANNLLVLDRELNSYLARTAKIKGIAELFLTDRYGFNVAYSNRVSDLVQKDEDWWKKAKEQGSWVSSPAFDQSSQTDSVDIVTSIADPNTGEFIGVIKSILPAKEFEALGEDLKNTGRSSSQRLQLIDTPSGRYIIPEREAEAPEEISAEIEKVAKELVKNLKNWGKDGQIEGALKNQSNKIGDIKVKSDAYEGGREKILIASFDLGNKIYTLVTVPRTKWATVASIDRGEITSAGSILLFIFASTAVVLSIVAVAIAFWLARRLSAPIDNLARTAEQVAAGNFKVVAKASGTRETHTLARSINNLLVQVRKLLGRQAAEARQAELLSQLARANDDRELETSLNKLLAEARFILKTDRVIVYRFDENWQGKIIAESVATAWPRSLGAEIYDPCFAESYIEKYQLGRVQAIEDIYEAGLTDCHLKQLEPFGVKANLVVPINIGGELFGLAIAHQCDRTRPWRTEEINYFSQFATQIGISLSSFSILEGRLIEAERERQQKESLQQELLELLNNVEGASQGDLTVRAEITTSEIGIVADFFNAIIENLRDIVTQVKVAATQVNNSLGQNDVAIRQLADESLKQATQIDDTLHSVERMARSISEVAKNAKAAAEVASTASTTAQTGAAAMESTVETILQMRETVSETAKKVKRLGESSQQISKVVSLIDQIAMQTNLLAINAGIEAARAGEEGRGFAVVAEEVGQLAEQSAAATKEIEQIIESIQRETIEVAEAMEIGTTQVVEGTRLVEQTKESLGKIVEVSERIDQLVESISNATVSQARTSQSVTNLMQEIAKISQKTSESSRQVSGSLQKTVEIAKDLQVSVSTFKVED